MADTHDANELEQKFGVDRARASQRIILSSARHEKMIQEFMHVYQE